MVVFLPTKFLGNPTSGSDLIGDFISHRQDWLHKANITLCLKMPSVMNDRLIILKYAHLFKMPITATYFFCFSYDHLYLKLFSSPLFKPVYKLPQNKTILLPWAKASLYFGHICKYYMALHILVWYKVSENYLFNFYLFSIKVVKIIFGHPVYTIK